MIPSLINEGHERVGVLAQEHGLPLQRAPTPMARVDTTHIRTELVEEHVARNVNGKETVMPTASFVFTTEEGRLLRRNIYVDHFKLAVLRAGLPPKLTFHDLRKAAGSIAASPTYGGHSAKTVQNLLGHSVQQVTTETYIAEFSEDAARLRASLERIYSEAGPAVHLQCDPDSTVTSMGPRRRRKAG